MGTCFIIYRVSAKNLQDTSLEFASVFSSQIVMNIDDFIEEYDRVTKTVLVDNDIIYKLDNNSNPTVPERVNNQLYLRKIMMRLITLKPEIKNICLQIQFYQFNTDGNFIEKEV